MAEPGTEGPWKCYHCGFLATTSEEGLLHFGECEDTEPLCLDKRMHEQLAALATPPDDATDGLREDVRNVVRTLSTVLSIIEDNDMDWPSDEKSQEVFDIAREVCALAALKEGNGDDATDGVREAQANARLIASAPDLLEALEGLLDFVRDLPHTNDRTDVMAAVEAIAKAKGEA